jgi:acetylornithine deacetylase/succinyl-diaminopimelate desuccinylase-like protein
MRSVLIAAVAVLGAASAAAAAPAKASGPRPDQVAFRDLYKELIETNTTLSTGSCTLAAEKLAVRLKAAGYADKDVAIVVPPDQPRQGALIATLAGTDTRLKPILLLAHLDVVEANRADWERDPFTLIEENGFFYARGASDDKAMAAAFADNMIRYKREGLKPKRSLRLALTCGEETPDNFNGVEWLIANRRDLLDAEFALNEGAGGQIDANGKKVFLGIQAGEKVYQDFTLRITNPGGHSSRPVKDNAIVRLSAGLTRVGAYDFPIALNEATRNHFARMADIEGGETGAAMKAMAADPSDAKAAALLARSAGRNSMMRTTCVPTQVQAGHAPNALPQRAEANVNCRILPGEKVEDVRQALVRVINDPGISVQPVGKLSPVSPPPPLNARILGPATKVAAAMWPGVPIVPAMSTGATDGRFLLAAGTPTYGLSGMFSPPGDSGAHGLNERIGVQALYEGRDFLYEVVKLYARN